MEEEAGRWSTGLSLRAASGAVRGPLPRERPRWMPASALVVLMISCVATPPAVAAQRHTAAASPAVPPATEQGTRAELEPDAGERGERALRFELRLFVDAETIDQAELVTTQQPRVDAAEIRMAELNMRGSLQSFSHKVQVGIVGGEVQVKDAYVEYRGALLALGIGQLKPINSMTSATTEIFMERAAVKSAFGSGRQIGIGLSYKTERWTFFAGGFIGAVTGRDNDLGRTWSSRITLVPVQSDLLMLHVGGNIRHRRREPEAALFGYRGGSLLHLGDRPVDTGAFADEDLLLGVEWGTNLGSFSLEGECMLLRASTLENAGYDRRFEGCYMSGSFLLSGAKRKYDQGRFLDIDVPDSVFERGRGVWQLALRHDFIDLSDDTVVGGEQRSWSVAVNWYMSEHLRLAASYGRAEIEGGLHNGAGIDALGFRLGIIW